MAKAVHRDTDGDRRGSLRPNAGTAWTHRGCGISWFAGDNSCIPTALSCAALRSCAHLDTETCSARLFGRRSEKNIEVERKSPTIVPKENAVLRVGDVRVHLERIEVVSEITDRT